MVPCDRCELSLTDASGSPVSIPLVRVPPGRFDMGSTKGLPFAPEEPVHEVTIASSLFVGQVPVTQRQYLELTGVNPSRTRDHPDRPVETVTWSEAKGFCERLSALTGRHVRLPSESEWEYVCRAASTTEYFFGDDGQALDEYAWFEENSQDGPSPVGSKKPNPWGLHDIVGNVWEWCEDVWHGVYDGAPQDGSAWMANVETQGRRCVRGGAWNMDAFRCRSSYRSFDWHDAAHDRLGFRIVVEE